jgi:hypothetical protein
MFFEATMSTRVQVLAFGAILALAAGAAGCEGRPSGVASSSSAAVSPPAAPSATAATAPGAEALARAEAAAKKLGGALRTRLTDAMNQGGPINAVRVCAEEAKGMTANVQKETGVSVGRASLRLRNAESAPPSWVGDWLTAQGERKAEGVTGMSAVVDTPKGKMARVIKPIAIEAACLSCHGDPASIANEVRGVLKEKYPSDRATGYAIGDLRGALWAEAPVGG